MDINNLFGNGLLDIPELNESRIGLDITWDLGIGIWLETTCLQLEENPYLPENQYFLTIGADYTFDIGNGLNSIAEIMEITIDSPDKKQYNDTYRTYVLTGTYPLTLLDQIQIMAFYAENSSTISLQFDWKRTYDSFILDCILYNTDTADQTSQSGDQGFSYLNAADESGLRLLVQYNF